VQELQKTNDALRAETMVRNKAEEKLRRSEGYLAEAQRLSHTGSWASIPAMNEIKYFSEECYRMLGFDPQPGPPLYEEFFQRVHPGDQNKLKTAVETAGREKVEFELDYQVILPGGQIRDIHVLGHPVFSPSGDLVEYVGTVMDVTERRRAEEEREKLRQAQADLARVSRVTTMGELTASLAHEIKQPIAAAITDANTCLRWLTRDEPDMEEARAAAKRVVKDANRASEIVSHVRMLFKKGASERELVDVNEVIREMLVLLHNETTRYSIAVWAELAAELPQVMGDRVQLQQVMMNLILNGIEAMKEMDGTRELAIKSQPGENGELIVSVSDTGVGLPIQQTEQIFNAFFTTKLHGTGMGLSISRSIIESHEGRLWAAANSPRGASFFITLPTEVEVHER
jgi:C4-dicarboxylate-specific signal transduction histidine kinase